jgi:hypothetical protein
MDEASYLLENIVDVQQQIPSPNPPLVDELVNLVPSSVNLVDQVSIRFHHQLSRSIK